jgi:hypothetical protein
MAGNLVTTLLDRRRDNDARERFVDVQASLRLWRRALIAEMSDAPFIPDDEKTETLLDLLHGELDECGRLMNATAEAANRMIERRTGKADGE